MVTAKLSLAEECQQRGMPLISSMGAGNKLDPTQFQTADIYDTRGCPLAKVMRRELRARGLPRLKVVYSPETSVHLPDGRAGAESGASWEKGDSRRTPGSVSFVPCREIGRASCRERV